MDKALCVLTMLLCCLGGVHRFYESRRRIFNDSRPDRQERVKLNLSLKKKRGYQKRVCNKVLDGLMRFINFHPLSCSKGGKMSRVREGEEDVGTTK